MSQMPLFPVDSDLSVDGRPVHAGKFIAPQKFEGSLVFGAVGDALGWPTEFRKPRSGYSPHQEIRDFVAWTKIVGGKFWGYEEHIRPGEYSDDTQLTLAIARSIDERGQFDANKFAYLELPLWLAYEKGGGRSIKTAARSLVRVHKKAYPCIFYRQRSGESVLEYREAGANGAAMRVLPIVLAHAADYSPDAMLRDAFQSAIITHGHPRALLGCLIHAGFIWHVLRNDNLSPHESIEVIGDLIENSTKPAAGLRWLQSWLTEWDAQREDGSRFHDIFQQTRQEAREYTSLLSRAGSISMDAFYQELGAKTSALKGSGLSTVFAGLYLFLRYHDSPEDAVVAAVNELGSDTDTIAAFAGALFGSRYGIQAVPDRWLAGLQDSEYILRAARRLHRIATGYNAGGSFHARTIPWDRLESLLSVYSWETQLFGLFLENPNPGEMIVHPALGIGSVVTKEMRSLLRRDDYQVHLVQVEFACGQTCTFHVRVARNTGAVSESEDLSTELERNAEVSKALHLSA